MHEFKEFPNRPFLKAIASQPQTRPKCGQKFSRQVIAIHLPSSTTFQSRHSLIHVASGLVARTARPSTRH